MGTATVNLYAVWTDTTAQPPDDNNNNQTDHTDATLDKINHMAYIGGYEDGTIKPNNSITREEVAAIFYRLLSDDSKTKYQSSASSFADVESSRWSVEAIASLSRAGVIRGYEDGSFRPQNNITRAEFATIAARFDTTVYSGSNLFSDISGHWAQANINRAASLGWIQGYEDQTFRPDQNITRAEAITMINRILNRGIEDVNDLLEGMNTFTDNQDTGAWYYLEIQEAANSHDYERKGSGRFESWTRLLN
jgi:hypothetical protein